MVQVAALLVNWFSAADVIRAVRSVQAQPVPCEVIVVDNSVDGAQQDLLRQALGDTVRLVCNDGNTGFAAACNQAYALTSAATILLLNPDAYLLPDALPRLLQALQQLPQAGAVAPRVFWEEEKRFYMPPSTFPAPWDYALSLLVPFSPRLASWRSRHFARQARRYWQTTVPLRVHALSGGHVLLQRQAIEAAGGLFDARFFLYWEDSDLMQRLRAAGYSLWLVPQAHAVHAYTHHPDKSQRLGAGWPPYHAKHLAHHPGLRVLERVLACRPAPKTAPPHGGRLPTLMPDAQGDLVVEVPPAWSTGWCLEVSVNPDLIPAIGVWGQGTQARVGQSLCQRLAGQRLYVRLTAQSSVGQDLCWQVLAQPCARSG